MQKIHLKNGESLQKAIDNAPENSTIILEARKYREKIKVSVNGLTIEGVNGSKIVYGDYANNVHADGLEYNTFRTYTLIITASNVTLKNLEIENDAYSPKTKGQAVALSVYGDNFVGENLVLKSMQDTLFLGPLPDDLIHRYDGFLKDDERYVEGDLLSVFKNCKIYGSVDYIFGCGKAYFYACDFINIDDNRPIAYVIAPAHSLKQKDGFTFYKCNFLSDKDCLAEVFLARPWRDYGKCVFIDCEISERISPFGFDRWNDTHRNLTARFLYSGVDIKNPVDWSKKLSERDKTQSISKIMSLLEDFNLK